MYDIVWSVNVLVRCIFLEIINYYISLFQIFLLLLYKKKNISNKLPTNKLLLMKTKYIILVLGLVLAGLKVQAQAGALDTSFGTGGFVLFNGGTDLHDSGFGIHVYDDLSMIVVGTQMDFNYEITGVMQRYLNDGSLDASWGSNGTILLQYGSSTLPYNVEVLSDGRYYVSGTTYVTISDAEFFVARFNADGTPDLTFNSTGVWIGSYGDSEELCFDMALQPDGKIVLGGQDGSAIFSDLTFARINTDGTLDTSFGTDGYTVISTNAQNESVRSVGILSTGEIIGIGYVHVSDPSYTEFLAMVKLDPNGTPVTSFGGDGVVIPSGFNSTSYGRGCLIVNDDVIATGYLESGVIFITKLDHMTGNPITTFGDNGIDYQSFNNPFNVGREVILGGDNKLYLCGTTGQPAPGPREIFLARYDLDGNLDPSFNSVGYVTTEIRTSWDDANDLTMAPDGKIVVSGFSSGASTTGDNDRVIVRYLNDYAPPVFNADFNASPTNICEGEQVTYNNLSQGTITSYLWTFEGGSPATSTDENPIVTYATTGTYTAKLVISDGTQSDSLTREDYIQVDAMPTQPDTPDGPDIICQNNIVEYTTFSVAYANSYEWDISPANAGVLTGADTIVTFEPSTEYTGDYAIKVRANGTCGDSDWSDEIYCELNLAPAVYSLIGDGTYCEGTDGAELIMDGSQEGINYELFLDDVSTGIIVAGTGESFSFGLFTSEGIYSVIAFASSCDQDMIGNVWVHEVYPPEQPEIPIGPEIVCATDSTEYYINPITDIDEYSWYLSPETAGILIPDDNSVIVAWNKNFSGTVSLVVTVSNNCGDSSSDPIIITVNEMPTPIITGPNTICDHTDATYEVPDITGSSWEWIATGGTIISGQGSNIVDISWGLPGTGEIIAIETSADGCVGSSEPLLITIDDCIGIIENEINDLIVYPNPVNDILFVERNNSDKTGQICIVNAVGVTVYKEQMSAGTSKISVRTDNQNSGLYFLIYTEENNVVYTKPLTVK